MSSRSSAVLVALVVAAWIQGAQPGVLDLQKDNGIRAIAGSSVPLASRLGVNIHSLDDDAGLDAAQSAGFSFVRIDLTWAQVEKNSRYDFSGYDRLLSNLEARGMGVLWILDYGHPEHGGVQPRSEIDFTAFGRYAQAAAAHFQGHQARYEIWNEPNLKKFLPDASRYPQILSAGAAGIRRGDASAIVSTGGVSGLDFHFLGISELATSARQVNAIGVHPYRSAAPETLMQDFPRLRAFINKQFGREMAIWDTEWGYSSTALAAITEDRDGYSGVARKRQAVFAAREFLTVWILGLPVAVWYDLRDDGSNPRDPEANFGLVDQSGKDKPAMRAVHTLLVAAKGQLIGAIAHVPAGVQALKLQDGSGYTFVIWCDEPGRISQVRFAVRNLVSLTNLTGEEIRPGVGSGDEAAVQVGEADGPIYVKLQR